MKMNAKVISIFIHSQDTIHLHFTTESENDVKRHLDDCVVALSQLTAYQVLKHTDAIQYGIGMLPASFFSSPAKRHTQAQFWTQRACSM